MYRLLPIIPQSTETRWHCRGNCLRPTTYHNSYMTSTSLTTGARTTFAWAGVRPTSHGNLSVKNKLAALRAIEVEWSRCAVQDILRSIRIGDLKFPLGAYFEAGQSGDESPRSKVRQVASCTGHWKLCLPKTLWVSIHSMNMLRLAKQSFRACHITSPLGPVLG